MSELPYAPIEERALDALDATPTDTAALEARTEARMLAEHGIALGVWGIPKGAEGTFSRRAFYAEAVRLGVVTTEEHAQLARRLASVWNNDLSD